jgi:hypothetical protein
LDAAEAGLVCGGKALAPVVAMAPIATTVTKAAADNFDFIDI